MTQTSEPDRLVSKDGIERIVQQILEFAKEGSTEIQLNSWWSGTLRWARNRATLASDRRDVRVVVHRTIPEYGPGTASTNQFDPVSLEGMVRAAERSAKLASNQSGSVQSERLQPSVLPLPAPTIWSEATYAVTAEQRAALTRTLTVGAEEQGLLSGGYIEMQASESAKYLTSPDFNGWEAGRIHYARFTKSQCSMTVRHPDGVGSGWAGLSSFDWSAINGGELAARALEKCTKSLNPVAIEPGRYTVVLAPQAVYDLVRLPFGRRSAEGGINNPHPFYLDHDVELGVGRSRLGLRVVDERLTISHDPMHPQLGILPEPGLAPITYIERGVLKTLDYDRDYAIRRMRENMPMPRRSAFYMSGGTTSIEEMIRTTKRGLFVTRFSGVQELLVSHGFLMIGTTRDGLWLIENGMLSKAVKNMRFTDSPMFVLNKIEQLGVPEPVFTEGRMDMSPLMPAIVPPLKTKDFCFTSMVDAI